MNCPRCQAVLTGDARFCGGCGYALSSTETASGSSPQVPAEYIGREIAGRYRIISKLGEGGMGAVYRAEQISLKRQVAIKLLRPGLSADPNLVRRFNAEAELAAKLNHPNTVSIYDFGQDRDGTLYIAMEHVEGQSLRHVLRDHGPLPVPRALAIAGQIAASLGDAHALGIVHRDLKPDNVMLTERLRQKDIVRVLDFGIAKLRDDNRKTMEAMTQAGDLLGTPQYMSPEQVRGERIDGRSDVYALGAVLFEMITGRLLFEGNSVLVIISKHLTDAPDAPSRRRPDLQFPPGLDELVLAALAKDPATRIPSMEVFAERIAAVAAVPTTGAVGAQVTPLPSGVAAVGRPPGVPSSAPGLLVATPAPMPVVPPVPPPVGLAPAAEPLRSSPSGSPLTESTYPQPAPPAPPRRGGMIAWVGAGVFVTAAGAGAFVWSRRSPAKTPPAPAQVVAPEPPREPAATATAPATATHDPWAVPSAANSGGTSTKPVLDDPPPADRGDAIDDAWTSHRVGGTAIELPSQMTEVARQQPGAMGLVLFRGDVDNTDTVVMAVEVISPGIGGAAQNSGREMIKQFGKVRSQGKRMISGRRVNSFTIDIPSNQLANDDLLKNWKGPMVAELVVASTANKLLLFGVGTAASRFPASASFRDDFFERIDTDDDSDEQGM